MHLGEDEEELWKRSAQGLHKQENTHSAELGQQTKDEAEAEGNPWAALGDGEYFWNQYTITENNTYVFTFFN